MKCRCELVAVCWALLEPRDLRPWLRAAGGDDAGLGRTDGEGGKIHACLPRTMRVRSKVIEMWRVVYA